jgi:hypothetical protein
MIALSVAGETPIFTERARTQCPIRSRLMSSYLRVITEANGQQSTRPPLLGSLVALKQWPVEVLHDQYLQFCRNSLDIYLDIYLSQLLVRLEYI